MEKLEEINKEAKPEIAMVSFFLTFVLIFN